MDRNIETTELELAEEFLRSAIIQLEDILYDVEKEAKADYDNIEKICNTLTMRTIRLWHKYALNKEEEKQDIINTSPS